MKAEVYTATYEPLAGSSFILLPLDLIDIKYIFNIKNCDNKWFLWCILAHLHPAEDHKNRVTHYTKYEHELDVTGISFPVQLNQIKFEKRNKMAINVIVPLRLTTFDYDTKINLLMISHEENNNYCLVINLITWVRRNACLSSKSQKIKWFTPMDITKKHPMSFIIYADFEFHT